MSKKITNNDNKVSFPNVVEKKSTVHDKFWCVPLPKGKNYKRFLDFQNDVAVSDIEIALREGYRSIEHVKRYTTLGMATDQGKTSNLNGLQLVSKIEIKLFQQLDTQLLDLHIHPFLLEQLLEEKLENTLSQPESHQCTIGMKKIMLFLLMQVCG